MGRRKKDFQYRFSFEGLYGELCGLFDRIADPRGYGCKYPISSLLRMGFAMFSLKSSSLYSFQRRSQAESHNMKRIYGINDICSDNCLRQGLDELPAAELKSGFKLFYQLLKSYSMLSPFTYWKGQKLVSIDGVEHFHSTHVHCPACLVKSKNNGELHYSHAMLVAALVHPDQQEVFPLGCEAILRQDGARKNDCELSAARRMISQLRATYPSESFLLLEDALFANGPHIDLLRAHDFSYIIGVKPLKHKSLFAQFKRRSSQEPSLEVIYLDDKGDEHRLSWANNLALNTDRADIRVNMLDYQIVTARGKNKHFSWITDVKLRKSNVKPIARAGRSRWKIENETFNTLKNQGYHFEHNFGHGYKHLATVFATLMLLAFTLDQLQQHASKLFIELWKGLKTRKKLWEAIRSAFAMIEFDKHHFVRFPDFFLKRGFIRHLRVYLKSNSFIAPNSCFIPGVNL